MLVMGIFIAHLFLLPQLTSMITHQGFFLEIILANGRPFCLFLFVLTSLLSKLLTSLLSSLLCNNDTKVSGELKANFRTVGNGELNAIFRSVGNTSAFIVH